jgi:hypothetical protein
MMRDFKKRVEDFAPTLDGIWDVRGDVLAIRTVLEGRRSVPHREEAIRTALEISEVCVRFHDLLNELKRDLTSKGYTQLAVLFDMATVGSLVVHDLMDGRWTKIKDLMAAAFSEGSMILASIQYVKSAEQVLLAMVEEHINDIYGRMWDLIATERKGMKVKDVIEAREALDEFFKALRSEGAPLEMRIMALVLLYTVILKVKSGKLLKLVSDRGLGLST